MNSVINSSLVRLDVDFGDSTTDVIKNLATVIFDAGRASSADALAKDALDREAKSGTGVPGQVAIPHCRSEAVSVPTLGFARLSKGVDFSGPDGDANLVFLIAAPAGGGKEHLKILSKLARSLVKKDFIKALQEATTEQEIVDVVDAVLNPAPKTTSQLKLRLRRRLLRVGRRRQALLVSWQSPHAQPVSHTPTWLRIP